MKTRWIKVSFWRLKKGNSQKIMRDWTWGTVVRMGIRQLIYRISRKQSIWCTLLVPSCNLKCPASLSSLTLGKKKQKTDKPYLGFNSHMEPILGKEGNFGKAFPFCEMKESLQRKSWSPLSTFTSYCMRILPVLCHDSYFYNSEAISKNKRQPVLRD